MGLGEQEDNRESLDSMEEQEFRDNVMQQSELEKDVRFAEEGHEDEGFLHGSRRPQKSRRPRAFVFVLVGILLGSAVLGALAASSFSTAAYTKKSGQRHLTMDHVFNGTFSVKSSSVAWVEEAGDGIFSHQTNDGHIVLEDAGQPGEVKLLVNATQVVDSNGERIRWVAWKLSADMQYVMFKTDYKKLWRHSSYGNYWIHRLSDHLTFPLSIPSHPATVSYVAWSPVSHSIAFVEGNDIYVATAKTIDDHKVAKDSPQNTRVTDDGNEQIFNGVPDWVYEEEVFQNNWALWWNPLGTALAFLKSDETDVRDYTLQYYNLDADVYKIKPYPSNFVMKYPKPGTPNPLVAIYVFSLGDSSGSYAHSAKRLRWDGEMELSDRIITEVTWVGPSDLLVKELDRPARKGNVVLFENGSHQGHVVRSLGTDGEEGDDGWIDSMQSATALPGSSPGYLDIVPTPEGYNHIAYFSPLNSSEPIWITSGEWEVTGGIAGLDLENRIAYFLAANPSTSRHLYSAALPEYWSTPDKEFVPSTVSITNEERPGYHAASFSPSAGYYVLNYQGPDIPWTKLVTTKNETATVLLEGNKGLNETVADFVAPLISRTTIMSDGYELNAIELLPPNFDASGRHKYPVLFQVYGGPGSQKVSTKFERDWHYYLACEQKIIVVTVDGRGTGFKGRAFRNPVRDHLGRYEVIDQVNAAKAYAKKRFVDYKRIGIWGWSYGGYMATKTIEADSGVFSLGMAVAPVTSWRFYDSIYTERYMNTLEANPDGYDETGVNNVTGFKNADFMLAHGSGDDNVHYANTASLLDKFTAEKVRNFRFRMFTDSDHSMNRRGGTREVMEMMTAFLDEKWGLKR